MQMITFWKEFYLLDFPISTFSRTDTFDGAISLKISKMLFYGFDRKAYLPGKERCAQLAIFWKQGNDFLPTFSSYLPT